MSEPDVTPCYRADCPVCHGWIAVAVADVKKPEMVKLALSDRRKWERLGYHISVVTVQSIRDGPRPGHRKGCARDLKQRKKP